MKQICPSHGLQVITKTGKNQPPSLSGQIVSFWCQVYPKQVSDGKEILMQVEISALSCALQRSCCVPATALGQERLHVKIPALNKQLGRGKGGSASDLCWTFVRVFSHDQPGKDKFTYLIKTALTPSQYSL